MNRSQLSPTGARDLFSATSGHHPYNVSGGPTAHFVMRGGLRF